ncbi:transcriptional regulator [Sphaerisporangium krabiense]|uniref:DNA-binding PadR family transcriptional regulator n=1 Tax=Sphaerisporangium krabiense TaxID=763782 RepID=A0A7W8Z0C1_9ACTN|nr:PadR family transcriptional regulator [Sphaerisporangium krabiense]MBB5624808.1 DNA-binding PadR family transcriptional regulator [Sphaerisporangium krabiense]GII66492.1 transcriptional regulator [Sphaerisporangium krabiense]
MSLRIALLGLLSTSGPGSGYDLAKAFERSINYVWHAGHSQIYPELAKMAADGLVTVEAQGTRGRKTYAITDQGSEELHRWLTGHRPAPPVRSEGALLAFLLPLLDPAEAIGVLSTLEAEMTARLHELEQLRALKRSAQVPPRGGLYALDFGIRSARTGLEWIRATADDIAARATPGDAGA